MEDFKKGFTLYHILIGAAIISGLFLIVYGFIVSVVSNKTANMDYDFCKKQIEEIEKNLKQDIDKALRLNLAKQSLTIIQSLGKKVYYTWDKYKLMRRVEKAPPAFYDFTSYITKNGKLNLNIQYSPTFRTGTLKFTLEGTRFKLPIDGFGFEFKLK